MRDKWDKRHGAQTYGAMTIDKAISGCREIYSGYSAPSDRSSYKEHDRITEIPRSYKPLIEDFEDFTDAGNAKMFSQAYKDIAFYTATEGWFVWNGIKWEQGNNKEVTLAEQLTDNMAKEAKQDIGKAHRAISRADEADDRDGRKLAEKQLKAGKEYLKHAKASRGNSRINGMLEIAQAFMFTKPDKLDSDPHVLNTPAGIVDLKTGAVQPHKSKKYCTKVTRISPGKGGMQLWLDFLGVVSCEDPGMINFLQQLAGMILTGKVYEETLINAIGSGRNAKSTFFNVLAYILGDYACMIAPEMLTITNKTFGAEKALLKAIRLAIAAETAEGERLNTSMLKQLVSTDLIHCERKYKAPEDFVPSHTVVLYTNNPLRVGTTDNGTWRRLMIIPFNAVIPENSEIKNYASYLAEHAGGAILTWMIEGAMMFAKNGYTLHTPEAIELAKEEYQIENDWMGEFLEEHCDLGYALNVQAGSLYQRYYEWAKIAQGYIRRKDVFTSEMTKRGFEKRRNNKGIYWYGLSLKPFDFQGV